MSQVNEESVAELAASYIHNTDCNIFLTGKAGTGKTTFLKKLIRHTYKNTVVVAPTGIAAINAGGVTIHSQFQLPFGPFVPDPYFNISGYMSEKINTPETLIKNQQMGSVKRKILREVELLIIDEVSMLRADVLDAIDTVLRSVRRKRQVPFGGVQVLFIGDLLQLPPVVRNDEWSYLKNYYSSIFFFNAHALKQKKPIYIELDKVYRQSDYEFITILNNLRNNTLTEQDCDVLNKQVKIDFVPTEKDDRYIFLTTHNRKADAINERELAKIDARELRYEGLIKGDFPESMFPLSTELILKKGAQVMFVKNDYSGEQRFFNGKIGVVSSLGLESITVSFEDGSKDVEVEKFLWENKKYVLNETTGEIEEKLKGSFLHYPLRLAWAITIHKSQGLTFEKAIIDIEKAFAPGQIYVALSRLTSLQGLVLTNPISPLKLSSDAKVAEYISENQEIEIDGRLGEETKHYMVNNSIEAFNFANLVYEFKKELATFVKDPNKSKKQSNYEWMEDRVTQVENLHSIGNRFIGEIKRISAEYDFKEHLQKRVEDAFHYFEPLFENLMKAIALHIFELEDQKAVKTYVADLRTLQGFVVSTLARIKKTVNCNESISQDRLHQKSSEEVEVQKVKETTKKKLKTGGKGATTDITIKLYKEGKTLIEAAKIRDLSVSTIETHLSKGVESGELHYQEFLSEEKFGQIKNVVKNEDIKGLSNIRAQLGDDYSFFEIKIALAEISKIE